MTGALPRLNPVCVHDWKYNVRTCVHECQLCGFSISEVDLRQPAEGEGEDVVG